MRPKYIIFGEFKMAIIELHINIYVEVLVDARDN